MPPLVMHGAVLLADTFAAAAWTSAVLAIGVAVCLRLLPELPAKLRSAVWMLTFTVAMVLPLLMGIHQPSGTVLPESHVRLHGPWALPVAALWIALSLYRAYGLLHGVLYLHAVTRQAVQTDTSQALTAWIAEQACGMFSRRVQVRETDGVDRPSVVGYLRPRILLPSAVVKTASEADLRQILLHELEHVRRFDDCTNLLQNMGVALFPFSPALLWMERRLCLERELACDDAVLRATGAPKAYAACLTQLAEGSLRRRAALLAVAALGRQSELSRRVYRIVQWPPREVSRFAHGLAAMLLLCGLSAGTLMLGHSRSLITFVDPVQSSSVVAVESHGLPADLRGTARVAAQHGASVRLVNASFIVPQQGFRVHTRTHFHCATAKAHNLRARARYAATASAHERLVQMPVEHLIEYAPVPVERETAPVLQQISLPYAVIPTGNGWLIVQL